MLTTNIERIDYNNQYQVDALIGLLNAYASDPMGGGKPLPFNVLNELPNQLKQRSDAISLLAKHNDEYVGLLNAFEGFSTFSAKPLINIHDVYVKPEYRGLAIAQKMILAIEKIGIERNCCKLTLEVLNKNEAAKSAYKKIGFHGYELDPEIGQAVFWQKEID